MRKRAMGEEFTMKKGGRVTVHHEKERPGKGSP